MDESRFDHLSHRVGTLALPLLARRGVLQLLGGTALAGALGWLDELAVGAAKKRGHGGAKTEEGQPRRFAPIPWREERKKKA